VLGAGVIGLTTAICVAEAGASVAVHAARPPQQTTSLAAGALWGPHLVGADERVGRWASVTLDVLRTLSTPSTPSTPSTANGPSPHEFVHECSGVAATRTDEVEPPEFASQSVTGTCPAAEIPAGYRSGWRLSAPLVAMAGYLDYLTERLQHAGGRPLVTVSYPTLAAAATAARSPVLVNCSGTGARELVPDPGVVAYRGQVVVVANPGLREFFVGAGDGDDLTYFFPHGDRVVLGGTEQAGNWSLEPDRGTAEAIVARCAAVEPRLGAAPVLSHRVGLRPFRPAVRLEREDTGSGPVIVHNYGHGGSGVTLAWGCAQDAAALALGVLGR
jgi:D-amino-acid oxidase